MTWKYLSHPIYPHPRCLCLECGGYLPPCRWSVTIRLVSASRALRFNYLFQLCQLEGRRGAHVSPIGSTLLTNADRVIKITSCSCCVFISTELGCFFKLRIVCTEESGIENESRDRNTLSIWKTARNIQTSDYFIQTSLIIFIIFQQFLSVRHDTFCCQSNRIQSNSEEWVNSLITCVPIKIKNTFMLIVHLLSRKDSYKFPKSLTVFSKHVRLD